MHLYFDYKILGTSTVFMDISTATRINSISLSYTFALVMMLGCVNWGLFKKQKTQNM